MIRAVVTDIEGTTSSLSFVKDVLFPYARVRLPGFVRARHGELAVSKLLSDTHKLAGETLDLESTIALLIRWIDEDRKATPLKVLQGMIWEAGYKNGELRGHVYPDALKVLQRWHAEGIALFVYSSGSVHAQNLLFGHTEYGDLTPLFSGYFDTQIGAKMEAASYLRIVTAIGFPEEQILFLSDIEAELDAAHDAGLHTGWLVRAGELKTNAAHRQYRDFHEIDLRHLHD